MMKIKKKDERLKQKKEREKKESISGGLSEALNDSLCLQFFNKTDEICFCRLVVCSFVMAYG